MSYDRISLVDSAEGCLSSPSCSFRPYPDDGAIIQSLSPISSPGIYTGTVSTVDRRTLSLLPQMIPPQASNNFYK